jgi:hypothetical protein
MLSHISGDLVRLIRLLGKGLDPRRLPQHDYDRLNDLVSSLITRCESEPELKLLIRALAGAELKQAVAEQLSIL